MSHPEHINAQCSAVQLSSLSLLPELIEQHDAAMVVIELEDKKQIQTYLNYCRDLRVPYLFVLPGMQPLFEQIAVPVTFLEEEKEKAPFAAAFGRFCKSHIHLIQPKDYGTKAMANINAIKSLLDTFTLNYSVKQSNKDSFKVEFDVTKCNYDQTYNLIIISASREYGLDDIIFGSKEKKILKVAQSTILVINPPADLYALCD